MKRSPSAPVVRASLLVAILCALIGVAGFALDLFGERLGLGKGELAVGRAVGYVAFAACAAAWWVHQRYPDWIQERERPGNHPVLDDESRKQPLWLLAASMIAPYPAIGALLLGLGLAVALLFDHVSGALVDPAKLAVGLLAVAVTSTYVLAVVTKRNRANEATAIDLLASASALAALALASSLLLPLVLSDVPATPRGSLAWACAIATVATAGFAFAAAARFKPKDTWGRDEPARWSYRKKKHA